MMTSWIALALITSFGGTFARAQSNLPLFLHDNIRSLERNGLENGMEITLHRSSGVMQEVGVSRSYRVFAVVAGRSKILIGQF